MAAAEKMLLEFSAIIAVVNVSVREKLFIVLRKMVERLAAFSKRADRTELMIRFELNARQRAKIFQMPVATETIGSAILRALTLAKPERGARLMDTRYFDAQVSALKSNFSSPLEYIRSVGDVVRNQGFLAVANGWDTRRARRYSRGGVA